MGIEARLFDVRLLNVEKVLHQTVPCCNSSENLPDLIHSTRHGSLLDSCPSKRPNGTSRIRGQRCGSARTWDCALHRFFGKKLAGGCVFFRPAARQRLRTRLHSFVTTAPVSCIRRMLRIRGPLLKQEALSERVESRSGRCGRRREAEQRGETNCHAAESMAQLRPHPYAGHGTSSWGRRP